MACRKILTGWREIGYVFWGFKREAIYYIYTKKHTSTDWDTDVGISEDTRLLRGSTGRSQSHLQLQFLQNCKCSTKIGEDFFHDLAAIKSNKALFYQSCDSADGAVSENVVLPQSHKAAVNRRGYFWNLLKMMIIPLPTFEERTKAVTMTHSLNYKSTCNSPTVPYKITFSNTCELTCVASPYTNTSVRLIYNRHRELPTVLWAVITGWI